MIHVKCAQVKIVPVVFQININLNIKLTVYILIKQYNKMIKMKIMYENLDREVDDSIELDEWFDDEILLQDPEVMPSIKFQNTKFNSLLKYW